jgi:hypothetical protein
LIKLLKTLMAAALACAGCRTADREPSFEGTTLFYNGRIYLGDEDWSQVEAILVVDGRVKAVGGREELLGKAAGGRSFDLRGAVVVPGLQDAHLHLEKYGESLESVDLKGSISYDEVVERIARQAARQAPGTWILGRGWDQNLWPEKIFPHHQRLSERVPDHPVWAQRVDGHAALANGNALAIAGLTEADAAQLSDGDGRVVAGEDGRPSGVFVDAAMDLIRQNVPPPDRATRTRRILRGQDALIAAGLTAVHDMGVDPEAVDILLELKQAGRLKLRCIEYIAGNQGLTPFVLAHFPMQPDSRDLISVIGVKLVIDGALGSRGAALLEEYSDRPGEKGLLQLSREELAQRLELCAQAGLQPAVHAIGDRGNRAVLDALEAQMWRDRTFAHLRPRIEHAQIVAREDWSRFFQLGVIASMQPTHCTSDMPWAPERVGPERIEGAYAWRRLAPDPSRLALGSDCPVEDPDPLAGLYAALTRRRPDGTPPGGFPPRGQALDARSALAGFTSGAAFAVHQEKRRGRLTPGYFCDMTVLNFDPIEDEPERLLSGRVLLTVINGEIAYR